MENDRVKVISELQKEILAKITLVDEDTIKQILKILEMERMKRLEKIHHD